MLWILASALFMAMIKWWGMAGLVLLLVFAVPYALFHRTAPAGVILVKSAIAYGVISSLTLPFLDKFWLGELPVFAVIQLPKIELANWLRTTVVMEMIQSLGYSRRSFSPDFLLARPWALAITYGGPLVLFCGVIWLIGRRTANYRHLFGILLIVALVDYFLTLFLTVGPGLTLY